VHGSSGRKFGLLCECGKAKSQLKGRPHSLDINVNLSAHTAKSKTFKVSDPGNVPLEVAVDQIARPCVVVSPALPDFVKAAGARGDNPDPPWIGGTWMINAGGSRIFSEKCQPGTAGPIIAAIGLTSNATVGEPNASIAVSGSATGAFALDSRLLPIKLAPAPSDSPREADFQSNLFGKGLRPVLSGS
jgi:hypothetical protein